ncbi:MAG: DinB family protein [bacterium]|nr:DinB family protein [bacterium]
MQMSKMMIQPRLDYFHMIHGVTRRIVDQIPADKLDYKPTDAVRTFSETVQHMYGCLDSMMKMTKEGTFCEDTKADIKTKADLNKFVDDMFASAMKTWESVTDAELNRKVDAYGTSFDAWQFPFFAVDEHWHHRGALTIYLRMLGIAPIMIYDYQG